MNVARNHILHSVLPGELVQGEVWIVERHADQPGWPMRNDKLHGLRRVRLQIVLQKSQLRSRKLVRSAVVEDGEVGLSLIETVVRRVRGILAEQPLDAADQMS